MNGEILLVCGGRDFTDRAHLFIALDCFEIAKIIEGGARGADRIAAFYAWMYGIPHTCYPAAWDVHGRAAGALRNQRMLDEGQPTRVVAAPGGAGTADMVRRARRAGVPVTQLVTPWPRSI